MRLSIENHEFFFYHFLKKINLLFLFFLYSLFSPPIIAEATKTSRPNTSQEWAIIDGFRSAKFGSSETAVLEAVKNDFKVTRNSISRMVNPNEKTVTLGIDVNDLIGESGLSKVYYIFGYKSKKLIHVNIIWGRPVQKKPNAKIVVSTAHELRDYFSQKRYKKKGFALNAKLGEGKTLAFQGKDQKGRIVRLLLTNPKSKNSKVSDSISLTLSYIENAENPDVFKIKDGDF